MTTRTLPQLITEYTRRMNADIANAKYAKGKNDRLSHTYIVRSLELKKIIWDLEDLRDSLAK